MITFLKHLKASLNNNNNNNNNIKFIQEGICYKHTFIKLHPPVKLHRLKYVHLYTNKLKFWGSGRIYHL